MYLVLDIGTSYIKCACLDGQNNAAVSFKRPFPMQQDGNSFEVDFELCFETIVELLSECISEHFEHRSGIKAVLITSQAQTFVAVDSSFKPLHSGIVWLDERARTEADDLAEILPDFNQTAGFKAPLAALYVSKLLWLKNNRPDIYKNAKAFPLINEYLTYRLTGEFYSDSTGFGMAGMYNLSSSCFNHELLNILELTEDNFPSVSPAAVRGELLTESVRQRLHLANSIPVFLCGNDQGAAACGAGVNQPGDVAITFGTATVFYTITDSLTRKLSDSQIAGIHPIGSDYFLLNWESDFGIQVDRLKERFYRDQTYDQVYQTLNDYPDVRPINPNKTTDSPSDQDSARLCAGIVRYYLDQIGGHLNQIRQAAEIKDIYISGGMTRSDVWCTILKQIVQQPFFLAANPDSGLSGAVKIYEHRQNRRKRFD